MRYLSLCSTQAFQIAASWTPFGRSPLDVAFNSRLTAERAHPKTDRGVIFGLGQSIAKGAWGYALETIDKGSGVAARAA